VTLLSLLAVVVDEFLDVGLDDADFGQDLVGSGGPGERPGVGVPGCPGEEEPVTLQKVSVRGCDGLYAEPLTRTQSVSIVEQPTNGAER
jgi:hypothetical protein